MKNAAFIHAGFQIRPCKLDPTDPQSVLGCEPEDTPEFYGIYRSKRGRTEHIWIWMGDAATEDSATYLARQMRGMLDQLSRLHDAADKHHSFGRGAGKGDDDRNNEHNQLSFTLNMLDDHLNVLPTAN
ncbi:hypothetical protein PQD74_gp004 [Stenotrophomonas phage Siara]|uniref:Uncharacterized protein n=1 Tax=Stenotrophomonas phage Siara TaxID=2859658 RepID=A0AAE8BI81_9CAUD|nr:hypothetical protein PQD74_gp004 [Stenotrophomonas phage Siara]QYW02007.1 hypothetical protein CPT_Siara_004 [Stenotrophomonas phage Siara]